ncbi:MAG: HEAT repeat domain-containing protein [Archangiaceae bacterium]|nr:HEAT repeat domain-containing protein [Archangiaceae bacterium]
MDERPEALLKSALEKIVYFEARSEQLQNDLNAARAEGDRLRNDLASAAQREIELRRVVAELEVRSTRSHALADEAARATEALRRERAELIGKMLEASRIHGVGQEVDADAYDLASFISELRGEVIERRAAAKAGLVAAPVPVPAAVFAPAAAPAEAPAAPRPSELTTLANALRAEGRFLVPSLSLSGAGHTEETLFGFSVRELSAPDAAARVRAAERLKALGQPAAAPALATALHSETDPQVLVALLQAFACFARHEGVAVVSPLLTAASPEVRIAALKALLHLDPSRGGPHLAAAVKDPDRAVRRRASLLALTLTGAAALELGRQAIADSEPEVRALAALVLGASAAEPARPLLLAAMRDRELKVRKAAAQSLSRLLGRDVVPMVELDEANRRREVRKLQHAPSRPVLYVAKPAAPAAPARAPAPAMAVAAPASRIAVVTVESVAEALCAPVLVELRTAIRGRTVSELCTTFNQPQAVVTAACAALQARGQAVQRGQKFFVA